MKTIDEVGTRHFHVAIATVSALLFLGVGLAVLPVADCADCFSGEHAWVQAVFLVSVFLLDGLTALLLLLQSMASARQRTLAWLAAGYVFTMAVVMAQLFAFPGIVSAEGPLGGTQATLWLWVFWHVGFPCFVLGALAARSRVRRDAPGRPGLARPHALDLFPLAVALLAACAAILLSVRYAESVPLGIQGGDYRQFRSSPLAGAVVLLNLLTLAALIYGTRLRELLHLWLAVVLLAFNLDVILSVVAGERYTLGWYASRALSIAAAGGLLVALLIQHYWLHRNAEIRAALHEEEARRDPLTGLFNRRHLAAELAQELGRAQRHHHPLSVLMLDLDHFKEVNDRHGHVMGDECLMALAGLLNERVHRRGDFAARYGGEEFVIVLPETGAPGAMDMAEDIRRRVEQLHARGAAPCPITVSIGVATALPAAPPASVDELLAAADGRLYQAKRDGRNRIVGPASSRDILGSAAG